MSKYYEVKGEQAKEVMRLLNEKQRSWNQVNDDLRKQFGVKKLTLVHTSDRISGFIFPGTEENPKPDLLRYAKKISEQLGEKVFAFDLTRAPGKNASATLAKRMAGVPTVDTIMSYLRLNPFYSGKNGPAMFKIGVDPIGTRVVISLPSEVPFSRPYADRISDIEYEQLKATKKKSKKPRKAASTK